MDLLRVSKSKLVPREIYLGQAHKFRFLEVNHSCLPHVVNLTMRHLITDKFTVHADQYFTIQGMMDQCAMPINVDQCVIKECIADP